MKTKRRIYKKCEGCGNMFMLGHKGYESAVVHLWFHTKKCYVNWYNQYRKSAEPVAHLPKPNKDLKVYIFLGILLVIFILSGCTVTHVHGQKPKVVINNPIADKTTLRIKHGLHLNMYWYF